MSSIKSVAELAQVSITTVSHVINETRFVSEETREKVYKAMKELNYRPNNMARGLRSKKSKLIGLLVPITDNSNLFFMRIAHGIESALNKKGYTLLLGNTNENYEEEKKKINIFLSQQIEGLIIAPAFDEHNYLNEMIGEKFPIVFIDRIPKGFKKDYVLTDNFTGSYDAVSLLVGKGHRNIGYIGGSLHFNADLERLDGYKKALSDRGVAVDDALISLGNSNFEAGYELAGRLLADSPQITACFVASNPMAKGVVSLLQERGIRIPDDLSIVVFDDFDWTRLTTPPLTVIRQNTYDLGIKAAKALLRKIDNPNGPCKEYRLSSELIIRDSC